MDIANLVQYVDTRRPRFSSRIIPADEYLIDEISTLAKRPLPSLYLQYLRTMGSEAADFTIPWLSLNIMDVMDRFDEDPNAHSTNRFTLFAVHHPSTAQDVEHCYFDHERFSDLDCCIVSLDGSAAGVMEDASFAPDYVSFHEFLLFWASQLFGLNDRPFSERILLHRNPPGARPRLVSKQPGQPRGLDRLDDSRDLAVQMGFRPILPPTESCWAGERDDDVALRIHQAPWMVGDRFIISVGASDVKAGRRLCEIFEDNFGRHQP